MLIFAGCGAEPHPANSKITQIINIVFFMSYFLEVLQLQKDNSFWSCKTTRNIKYLTIFYISCKLKSRRQKKKY